MTETRWWRYLQHLMGAQTQLEAAKFIGISKSNITRWKTGARADPDFVVKVARAYGANVLEALVEAEFITEEEARLREVQVGGTTLTDATEEQLTDEILRRLKLGKLSDEVINTPADELAARRATRTDAPSPDDTSGYDPARHVAYHGPDEDQLSGWNDDDDHIP